jgi:membrane fusion protein (multidrug efflux system)
MAEADPAFPQETARKAPAPPARKPWSRWTLMLAVPLALLLGALLYWQSLAGKVSTDHAYVKQDMVSISAEVGRPIVEVRVSEGDEVKAGDLLFRIDPEPFRLQLAEANAALAAAQARSLRSATPRP